MKQAERYHSTDLLISLVESTIWNQNQCCGLQYHTESLHPFIVTQVTQFQSVLRICC